MSLSIPTQPAPPVPPRLKFKLPGSQTITEAVTYKELATPSPYIRNERGGPCALWTDEELRGYWFPSHPSDTTYTLYTQDMFNAHFLTIWNSWTGDVYSLGTYQHLFACCGATFVSALPTLGLIGKQEGIYDKTQRYLEFLCILSRGHFGRSSITAIAIPGQKAFVSALESLGFIKHQDAHISSKTLNPLWLYQSPRNLNWKFIPESVLQRAKQIRATIAQASTPTTNVEVSPA